MNNSTQQNMTNKNSKQNSKNSKNDSNVMVKEVQYNIQDFTNGLINRNTPMNVKRLFIADYINPSKYEFLGFEKKGSIIRLKPRFHNKRDSKGRFSCKRK